MPNLGPLEIIAILVIVFLLFGATRLPKLGKSMGQSIRGFKQGLEEGAPHESDEEKAAKLDAAKTEKGDVTDKA
jgi:sec-independent protein translocase protein TatA